MTSDKKLSNASASLRQKAEQQARHQLYVKTAALSETEIQKLLFEHEVLKLERELQQDELNSLKSEVEITSEKLRSLSNFTSELLALQDLKSIYEYITNRLVEFLPDTIVLYNSIDDKTNTVKLENIAGIDNKLFKRILTIPGFNPVGKKYSLIHTHDDYFRLGRLVEFKGNLAEFSASDLSPIIARSIERLIGLHKIYTIGIQKDESLLAAIHFFTFNKRTIPETGFIETLVKQTGIVLQKKYAEQQLIESEEHYRQLVDLSPNGIAIYQDARFVYFNPAAMNIMGAADYRELIGKPVLSLVHPDSLTTVIERMKQVEAGESLPPLREKLLRLNNEPFDANVVAIPSSFNNKPAVQLIVRDISEQKRAEEKTALGEKKYRELFHANRDGISIFLLHPEQNLGTFIEVNETAAKMLGYEVKEMLGKSPLDLEPNVTEPEIQLRKQSLLAHGTVTFETALRHKDGHLVYTEFTAQFIQYEGKPAIMNMVRDITERMQTEEALKESELTFTALFEKGPIGVAYHRMLYDKNGKPENYLFLASNQSYQKLTGVNPVGKLATEAFPGIEEDPANWIATFGEVAMTGKEVRFQQHLKPANRWYDCVAYQYKPDHFVAAFLEITDQKKAEETVQGINSGLLVLNEAGAGFTDLQGGSEFYTEIVRKLKNMTGGISTTLSIYDPSKKSMQVKHAEFDPGLVNGLMQLMGGKYLYDVDFPVSDKLFADMTRNPIWYYYSLSDATFGVIPKIAGTVFQQLQGVDRFLGIAHFLENELFGASMVALGPDSPEPPMELIQSFAHMVALALRRIRVEEQLRSSEEKYRTIFNNSVEGIFQTTLEGKYLTINPALAAMFGYESAGEMFQSISSIQTQVYVNPEDRSRLLNELNSNDGMVRNFESLLLRKDRSEFWVSVNARLVRNSDGKPLMIEGTCFDITERKKAIEALKESEEKFRGIIEKSTDGIVIADQEGNVVEWNHSQEIITGLKKNDFLGKPVWDAQYQILSKQKKTPEMYEHLKRFCEELLLTRVSDFYGKATEYDIQHKDGSIRNIENIIYPIISNERFLIGSITRDITERKQTEDAIRRDQILLRTLIDNLPDTIYVKDSQARKILANRADLTVIGVTSETEVFGKTDLDTFPNEIGTRGYADDLQILETGTAVINREEDFYDSEGRQIWLSTSKIPLHDDTGKITGLVGIGHNISVRKKNEAELIASKEKAEESDRLKTAFLQNMSHEIRTPMNAIIGFSDLLAEEELAEEVRKEYISIIQDRSNHLMTIINDILDLSKIHSNQLTIKRTPVRLNPLIDSLLHNFEKEKTRLNKGGVNIHAEKALTDENCTVSTDKVRLTQILNNLIGNSLKFTEQGHIRFGYHQQQDHLLFFVEDTGKGVAPDKQKVIFERFRQEEEVIANNRGGAGLGLSISKGLVELLGGKIWLESDPGVGSTFYFTIPFTILVNGKEAAIQHPQEMKKINFRNGTILVADDILENFILMKAILTKYTANLIHAENGSQAVHACREHPEIDLVLMDMRMPVMDGYEATREILRFRPGLPIIAVTAHAMSEEKSHCIKAGCIDYHAKPIDSKTLLKLIDQYIKI